MADTGIKNKKCMEFRNIFVHHGSKNIFSDLNLIVSSKEKVLISGKSGTGKTTLFKLLLGFDQPDKGNVRFNGMPIDKENIREIRQQLFYLSQDIDLKNAKTFQMIDEILSINGQSSKNNHKLNPLLSFLELSHTLLEQEIKNLSGGERQRIGLLICFLLDRPVWLLDEPTSALDDAMKQKIADYILDQDKTILVISHDLVWKNDRRIKIKRLN